MSIVIITGANGFVGRALCTRMLTEGWKIRGTVRSSVTAASLPRGTETIQIESIGSDTDWTDVLTGAETVIHLAARVHMMNDTVTDPLTAFRQVNVAGTEQLARMAVTAGIRRFIYISSIKVNGEGSDAPYVEHDTPTPRDPYGISKWEAEQVLHRIADKTGLEVVILRLPLVYGPGVKANFLYMFQAVERGIPLPFLSVHNRRSFIYLGNLVDAIVTSVTHPEAAGQTYLVNDGEDVSTPELIRRVAVALGRSARLFSFPPAVMRLLGKFFGKSAAVDRLLGSLIIDSTKIRRELNWKTPYTMNEGLKETAKWYLHKSIE